MNDPQDVRRLERQNERLRDKLNRPWKPEEMDRPTFLKWLKETVGLDLNRDR